MILNQQYTTPAGLGIFQFNLFNEITGEILHIFRLPISESTHPFDERCITDPRGNTGLFYFTEGEVNVSNKK